MSEEPDAERLRALEQRIAKARGKTGTKGGKRGSGFTQGEAAWRMVIELVSGMALGVAIGYGLDAAFGTRPLFLVIFALLGFAAGIRVMLGTAREVAAKGSAQDDAGKEGG